MNEVLDRSRAALSKRGGWVALLLIVIGGAVLRLAGLGAESADLEEYACIGALHTRGLHRFLVEQRALYPYGAPLTPLLYYLWSDLFGVSIIAVRLLSALAGTALILLSALLAREIWPGDSRTARTAGLIAALCVALSPVHLFQAQEARMYAFVALFAALSGLSLLRAVRTGRGRWWVLNLAANAALVWSHYLAAFLWPAQAVWLLFAKGVRWRALLLWLAVHVLLLAPVGLWMSGIAPQPKELHDYYIKPDLSLAVRNWVAGDAVHWSSSTFFPSGRAWSFAPDAVRRAVVSAHPFGDAAIAVAFSAALLWGVMRLRRRDAGAGYLVLWAALPLALLVGLSFAWKPVYASRYLVHASLALYLLLGGLLARLPASRRALCVTVLAVVYVWQLSLALPPQTRTAWKQTAAAIKAADGPKTITLIQGVFWKPIFETNLTSSDAVVTALLEPEAMAEMGAFLVKAVPAFEPGTNPSCWAVLVDAIHGQEARFEAAAAPYGVHLERRDYPGERRLDAYRISPASGLAREESVPPPAALLDLAGVIAGHADAPDIAAFQEAMRATPDVLGGGYVRLGVSLAQKGRVPLAAAVLDEALARFPAHAVDLASLGRAVSGEGALAPLVDRALERFKAAPERMPALRQVLQSLLERKDFDGLRGTAMRMIRDFPDYSQSYAYLALQFVDENRLDEAFPNLERAIELDPNQSARIYVELGIQYLRRGHCGDAIRVMEQGQRLDPVTGMLTVKLAEAHNRCGDAEKALAFATELLQRNPQYHDARFQRVEALLKLEKWGDAEAEAGMLTDEAPADVLSAALAWRVLSHQRKDADARRVLEKFAAASPGDAMSVKGMIGVLYGGQNRAASLMVLTDFFNGAPLPADVMETLNRLCPEGQPPVAAGVSSS